MGGGLQEPSLDGLICLAATDVLHLVGGSNALLDRFEERVAEAW
jgi:hypothetical protein